MNAQHRHGCRMCAEAAGWARHSQISGSQYYCDEHAMLQADFGQYTTHFFWEELYSEERKAQCTTKEHPTCVTHYEHSLQELAEKVLRMRYDKVGEFFHFALMELHRQVASDRRHGHPLLAALLDEAANDVLDLRELFARIYALCRQHMPGAP